MPTKYIPLEQTKDEKRDETLKSNNQKNISSPYSAEETFEPANDIQKNVRTTNKKTYDEKTGNTYQNGTFSKNKIDPKLSYVNVSKTGVQSTDNFLQNAGKLYNIKNEYETRSKNDPNFIYSDYAKRLSEEADSIRKSGNLSDDIFGAGVTSQDVLDKINYIIDSPEYKIADSNENYKKATDILYKNMGDELTNEIKTRAVLSYLEAKEQSENVLRPQIDEAIKNTVESQNNEAVRRGMYGQIPASILSAKALADVELRGQSAINDYAMDLINADKQDIENEYSRALQNKQNRLTAWELAINKLNQDYINEQNYYKDLINQRNQKEQAAAEKAQRDFENEMAINEFNLKETDIINDNNLGWAEYGLDEYDTINDNELNERTQEWKETTDERDFKEGVRQFNEKNAVDWFNATHKGSGGSGSSGLTYSQALSAFEKGDDSPEVISALASKNSTYNFNLKSNEVLTNGSTKVGDKFFSPEGLKRGLANGTIQGYLKNDGSIYYHFAGQP